MAVALSSSGGVAPSRTSPWRPRTSSTWRKTATTRPRRLTEFDDELEDENEEEVTEPGLPVSPRRSPTWDFPAAPDEELPRENEAA